MSKFAFDLNRYTQLYTQPWTYGITAFRVFGNLYFVGNRDGASWLVDTGEGLVLFDTNYPHTCAMLVDSIYSLGFNPRNILAIFHTHGHFDHFGATSYLQALSGCKTYLGEADIELFHSRPELTHVDDALYSYLVPFEPDAAVHDGDTFRFGCLSIRASACPGHSPGTMSYFFDVTDGSQTYTAGLHGGAGFNTLCWEYVQTHKVNWRRDFLNSIKKMETEHVDIFLGNHTPQNHLLEKLEVSTEACNPFINSGDWIDFLDGLRRQYAEMVQEEQEAGIFIPES